MKTTLKFAVMGMLAAALASTAPAQQFMLSGTPLYPNTVQGFMSPAAALTTWANNTKTATTSTAITLDPDTDLIIQPSFNLNDAANTANVSFYFNLAYDKAGTNFSTTYPLVITQAANGTTLVNSPIIFLKSNTNLIGATAIRWDKVVGTGTTNGTATPQIFYKYRTPLPAH